VTRRLLAALLLVTLAGAGAWWWLRQSLPPLDGQMDLFGLRAPVEVLYDAYGVPHMYSAAPEDAWFAAGAMHARDRLWQMELYRRVTRGRLAEILGEAALPFDKRFLSLGLREAAEAEWERAGPAVRIALERYANGVNAVVQEQRLRQRPLEMQLLRIVPEPWTPVDSLAVGRLLAWRLAENHRAELIRAALGAKLGADAARELTGRYPANAPTILGGAAPQDSQGALDLPRRGVVMDPLATGALSTNAEGPASHQPAGPIAGLEWLLPGAPRGNSNNWALAGARTKTGRPMLANDPHLQVEFPSVWYELHLVSADLDVAGVTIPGVPFIVIGHNARIAWGFTNSGADVEDLYVERIDVARKRYMVRGEWRPVEVTSVEIPVRGRAAEPFEIWKTRHGPLFSDTALGWEAPPAWQSPNAAADAKPSSPVQAYALRWDAVRGDVGTSFEALNRAQNWTQFLASVEALNITSQNIVYADIDGNIGYALSGSLPVRASGDGSRPSDGAGGEGEWVGTIEPEALPRVLNPASGFLTSSNNEIDRGYPRLVTRDWMAPFRARRMTDVLSRAQGVDLRDMELLQNDRQSVAAEAVLAGVPAAVARGKKQNANPQVIALLERLAAWDRIVDSRPVVTQYEVFEDALWRRALADNIEPPLFKVFYEWAGADRNAGIYAFLNEPQSRWWDDVGTIDRRETRDDIILLAAEDTEEKVRLDYGGDSGTGWDQVHVLPFRHVLGNGFFLFDWIFSAGKVPVTGDGTTIMRVSFNRSAPFIGWELPSWRQIFDVGQWDDARVVLPAGQSGHLLSPHRFDQNTMWREGLYRLQPFTRQAVEQARRHRLLLAPHFDF
jgi:penicillin amidase